MRMATNSADTNSNNVKGFNDKHQKIISNVSSNQRYHPHPRLINSASIDLEWIPYNGPYTHNKTMIYSAAFVEPDIVTNTILHIADMTTIPLIDKVTNRIVADPYQYMGDLQAEKRLILRIIELLLKYNLTIGWYSTGIRVYGSDNNNNSELFRGQDSDLFILHQRCLLHKINSPIGFTRKGSPYVLNRQHIDLYEVFSKNIIKNSVFDKAYRTNGLNDVGLALVRVGKYDNVQNTCKRTQQHNHYNHKLNNTTNGLTAPTLLTVAEQKAYNRRDAEIPMLLAQHGNNLILRIMEGITRFAYPDEYTNPQTLIKVCRTSITTWAADLFKTMESKGQCVAKYKSIEKRSYNGGNSITPKREFYINDPIAILDVSGMYPTLAIMHNISYDTINNSDVCEQCKQNPTPGRLSDNDVDQLNFDLLEKSKKDKGFKYEPRSHGCYQICQHKEGALPKILKHLRAERYNYKQLLQQEKNKPLDQQNNELISNYDGLQLAAKVFANSFYGVFGNSNFTFSDYRVAELITFFGRKFHRYMEKTAREKFGLEVVYGFTDSIFVKGNVSKDNIDAFIKYCRDNYDNYYHRPRLDIQIEHQKTFRYTMIFDLMNRYIGWTGNLLDPIDFIGMDFMSTSNPKWIRYTCEQMVNDIFKKVSKSIESCGTGDKHLTNVDVTSLILKTFFDIYDRIKNKHNYEDFKFSKILSMNPYEYEPNNQMRYLAEKLNAQKDDPVYYFLANSTSTADGKSYTIDPKEISMLEYKEWLITKIHNVIELASGGVITKVQLEKKFLRGPTWLD